MALSRRRFIQGLQVQVQKVSSCLLHLKTIVGALITTTHELILEHNAANNIVRSVYLDLIAVVCVWRQCMDAERVRRRCDNLHLKGAWQAYAKSQRLEDW